MTIETTEIEGMEEKIRNILDEHGPDIYPEAFEWTKKAVQEPDKAGVDLISRMTRLLLKELSGGLLQVTVEELAGQQEYTDAVNQKKEYAVVVDLKKDLRPFYPYAEFIAKCGMMEVGKARYDFQVVPGIRIQNARITIKDDSIRRVKFGSFLAVMTISLLRGGQDPITLGTLEKEFRPDWEFVV
jgi:hypothetical protein